MKKNKKNDAFREMQKALIEAATGPGFRKRVEADAALPDNFKADDGIVFKPEWQDDIVRDLEKPPTDK